MGLHAFDLTSTGSAFVNSFFAPDGPQGALAQQRPLGVLPLAAAYGFRGAFMRLEQINLPGDILLVKLQGPLDIAGAGEIDTPFGAMAGVDRRVIVDLSGVTFLASVGIRVLVKTARAIGSRKGRFVVFAPTDEARRILRSTGIDTIIPVVADQAAAIAECTK